MGKRKPCNLHIFFIIDFIYNKSNTLQLNCIEEMRIKAIQDSKSKKSSNKKDNMIVIDPEFQNLINNNIFPLSTLFILIISWFTALAKVRKKT